MNLAENIHQTAHNIFRLRSAILSSQHRIPTGYCAAVAQAWYGSRKRTEPTGNLAKSMSPPPSMKPISCVILASLSPGWPWGPIQWKTFWLEKCSEFWLYIPTVGKCSKLVSSDPMLCFKAKIVSVESPPWIRAKDPSCSPKPCLVRAVNPQSTRS